MSLHRLKNDGRISHVQRIAIDGPLKADKRGQSFTFHKRIRIETLNSVHTHINIIAKYRTHIAGKVSQIGYIFIQIRILKNSIHNFELDGAKEKIYNPLKSINKETFFYMKCNIGFKLPKINTCATSDVLEIAIKSSSENKEDKRKKNYGITA